MAQPHMDTVRQQDDSRLLQAMLPALGRPALHLCACGAGFSLVYMYNMYTAICRVTWKV